MEGSDPAGGSLSLADLIDKHGEKIFFDLHRYAGGLNLVKALEDDSGYSPRQLLHLIMSLPVESATMAALQGGDEFRGWGVLEYQIASLIDSVRENTYVLISANSKKKPEKPEPTYRPKQKQSQKTKPNSFAAMAAAFYNAAVKEP